MQPYCCPANGSIKKGTPCTGLFAEKKDLYLHQKTFFTLNVAAARLRKSRFLIMNFIEKLGDKLSPLSLCLGYFKSVGLIVKTQKV